MEILNEYLQRLLSDCGDELRLEPEMPPIVVSNVERTEIANAPLKGTQISTMIFPLIPANIKTQLPYRSEVEFVHPHNLGNFSFHVQKSAAGFIVSIRPAAAGVTTDVNSGLPDEAPPIPSDADEPLFGRRSSDRIVIQEPDAINATAALSYELSSVDTANEYQIRDIDSSSIQSGFPVIATNSSIHQIEIDDVDIAAEFVPGDDVPGIEIVPPNDPSFTTVFSDSANFDPPGLREHVSHEYIPQNGGLSAAVERSATVQHSQALAMDELFIAMDAAGASDLHLSVSMPPMIRVDGKMRKLRDGDTALTASSMRSLLLSIMPEKNVDEFEERHDTDFAYEIPGTARFRCNVFMDRKGMGGVFRIIPTKILTAEQLGLSKAIMDLCELSKGLVVVTGPTGSGKSTTLCAMVDSINKKREDHIITIEDPIEFVHDNHKCLVNQREVHNHTDSFKNALRAALREDPDILLVGEMRDLETISIAIETAETGHLVFGTLHTTTAASTVDRIIDQFPSDRQQQIRVMLSESLKGVIAQTLLPKKGGGRVAALEVLIVTPAISNLIREGKTFQIPSAMQTGKVHGMVMLNDALFEHVKSGLVEPRDAYIKAVDKPGFETLLTRGGFKL
jgi:twitching motility protein PilT